MDFHVEESGHLAYEAFQTFLNTCLDGFPQGAKKYFVIAQPSPRRLNVNKLSLNELKRHPYINYYQAKTIVD